MNAPTEIVTMQSQNAIQNIGGAAMMLDNGTMDKMMRVAEIMATSRVTIPSHLQKSLGDCLAVVMQATTWGMNPFSVAQKTYQIGGRLGYEAQLVSAVINNSGAVKDRFHFEWFGDWEKIIGKFKTIESKTKKDDNGIPKKYIVPDWDTEDEVGLGIKVWATIKGESEPRVLTLLLTQARTRNSTLWTEDPKQQIAYLAQSRWSRLYTPDVILGVYTPEELQEPGAPKNMGEAEVIRPDASTELIATAEAAASQGIKAYQDFFKGTGADNRKLLAGEHERLKAIAAQADKARTVDTPPSTPAAKQTVPAETNKQTGEVSVTFEHLMEKLSKAKNEDGLYVAMDWQSALDDQSRLPEVEAYFDKRLSELRAS